MQRHKQITDLMKEAIIISTEAWRLLLPYFKKDGKHKEDDISRAAILTAWTVSMRRVIQAIEKINEIEGEYE